MFFTVVMGILGFDPRIVLLNLVHAHFHCFAICKLYAFDFPLLVVYHIHFTFTLETEIVLV